MLQLHSPQQAVNWLRTHVRGSLSVDSRQIGREDGFIAWPGAVADGRQFVRAALAQGAAACLVEETGAEPFQFDDERVAAYTGLKAATGPIAAAWFNQPASELDVVAITGTNGKTSTAWWLAQALTQLTQPAPRRCGVIGTLGTGEPPHLRFNGLTTPDPVLLQQTFRQFVDDGLVACAIEASSIGLAERRLDGTPIRVAVFTNFTQDHLDYHASMQAYWDAKRELFAWPGLQAAVVNIDDARGSELAAALHGSALDLWTVSATQPARLRARHIRYGNDGLAFELVEGQESHALATRLIGDYNVSNLLGVIAAMRALGVGLAYAVAACSRLLPVPGRMECLNEAGLPLVAVDYAHTPDALAKALAALGPLARQRQGRLWCVFGCGGDRDATKRPLMAAVAEKAADQLVVTSDNPRNEKAEHIISQILLGLSHSEVARVQVDRARAIEQAIAQADPRDVILIAGKGHEHYQEIGGVKLEFNDIVQARGSLAQRSTRPAHGVAA